MLLPLTWCFYPLLILLRSKVFLKAGFIIHSSAFGGLVSAALDSCEDSWLCCCAESLLVLSGVFFFCIYCLILCCLKGMGNHGIWQPLWNCFLMLKSFWSRIPSLEKTTSGNMEHCLDDEAHALRLEAVSGPGLSHGPPIYSEGHRGIQLLKSTFLCLCVRVAWGEE